MLHADLFRFLCFDRGWDVQERLTGFGSVLDERSDLRGRREYDTEDPHIFDLLDGKICVRWDSDSLGSNVDNDHHRSSNKSFEEVVNLLVGSSKFRSCVIPPDHLFTSCKP